MESPACTTCRIANGRWWLVPIRGVERQRCGPRYTEFSSFLFRSATCSSCLLTQFLSFPFESHVIAGVRPLNTVWLHLALTQCVLSPLHNVKTLSTVTINELIIKCKLHITTASVLVLLKQRKCKRTFPASNKGRIRTVPRGFQRNFEVVVYLYQSRLSAFILAADGHSFLQK